MENGIFLEQAAALFKIPVIFAKRFEYIYVARLSKKSILFQIWYFQANQRALLISLRSCWRAIAQRSTTSWRLAMAQRVR
jgi:hypothetical protein